MSTLNVGRIKLAAACLDSQRKGFRYCSKMQQSVNNLKTPIADFGAIK
jgi:hypothetical protein